MTDTLYNTDAAENDEDTELKPQPRFDFNDDSPIDVPVDEGHVDEVAPKKKSWNKKVRKPRVIASDRQATRQLLETAWRIAGTGLQKAGHIPEGRAMAFEAPLAGERLDKLIAGTWLDAFIQPLTSRTSDLQDVGVLVALPVCVGLFYRKPEMAPIVQPFLEYVFMETVNDMVPVLREAKRKKKRNFSTVAELNEALDLETGDDPFQEFLKAVFAPVPGAPTESESQNG